LNPGPLDPSGVTPVHLEITYLFALIDYNQSGDDPYFLTQIDIDSFDQILHGSLSKGIMPEVAGKIRN
jgi:hypothetical protein